MSSNPNIALSAAIVSADIVKRGNVMTSFVHLEYSNQHPGVARVESAIDAAQQLHQGFSSTRGLATLLLSAVAAAVMVVAYQVMDSVAEGHLLMMWIAMWAAAFASLALFAGTARRFAFRLKSGLDSWSRSLAEARADERLWAMARSDARVMADLQSAITRSEDTDLDVSAAKTVSKPGRLASRLAVASSVQRAYQRNYI